MVEVWEADDGGIVHDVEDFRFTVDTVQETGFVLV